MESNSRNIDILDMYKPQRIMGAGVHGQVFQCLKKQSGEIVAVKKIKRIQKSNFLIKEMKMLRVISSLDPDTFNIVQSNQYFKCRRGACFIEFEILDLNTKELMVKRKKTFSLLEIGSMTRQLLVALHGLQTLGVIHTDVKPTNIMLVDHEKKPFKVKLIDFGAAIFKSEVRDEMHLQPQAFRAPEITLGLPISKAVDMWSLGCTLLFWYLGDYPFKDNSSYDKLRQVCHLLGVPDGELITQAKHGTDFFVQEDSQWRLKTPTEYENSQGMAPKIGQSVLECAPNLEDGVLNYYGGQSWKEHDYRVAFVDLVKKMFDLNPKNRITPIEALCHPFITMSFMPSQDFSRTKISDNCPAPTVLRNKTSELKRRSL